MKLLSSLSTTALLLVSASAPTARGQELDCSFRRELDLLGNGLIMLKQIMNPDEGTYTIEVTYDDIGWVAFGTSDGGQMVGGQVVIAKPDQPPSQSNPGKYGIAARAASAITLLPQQTLIDASFEQVDGQTILRYTKLLVEDGEREVFGNGDDSFIFAAGNSNTFGYHRVRGLAPLPRLDQCRVIVDDNGGNNTGNVAPIDEEEDSDFDFAPIENTGPPYRELWVAHGILMATSWGILLPLGIGCSLLRYFIPNNGKYTGLWFKLHMSFNGLAFVLMSAAFGIAVYAVHVSGRKHFAIVRHRTIGLVIYLFAFLQVLGGILRPHGPPPPSKEESETSQRESSSSKSEEDVEAVAPAKQQQDEVQHPPKKSIARIAFEILHRFFGFGLLGLAWYNCYIGIGILAVFYGESYAKQDAFWGVVGGISGAIFVGYCAKWAIVYKKKREEEAVSA